MDVFSTSSLALTAFTVDASKSSAPLKHTNKSQHSPYVCSRLCVCGCIPGSKELCILQVEHNIEEVVTPEDSSLQ